MDRLKVIVILLSTTCALVDAKFKRTEAGGWPPVPPMPAPDVEDMQAVNPANHASSAASSAFGMFQGPQRITKPEFKVNATYFVDKVMENVRKQLIKFGLDEVHPPDIQFEEKECKAGLYEGKIIGLTNFQRVGDVITATEPLKTKFRSAFGFTDVRYESGVELVCTVTTFDDGHMKMMFDNVTLHQVYRFNHASQILELDEFEVTMGECTTEFTGLGEYVEKGSQISSTIIAKAKQPFLDVFNLSFKVAVNIALQIARNLLFVPAPGIG